jgi:hypothetical protein
MASLYVRCCGARLAAAAATADDAVACAAACAAAAFAAANLRFLVLLVVIGVTCSHCCARQSKSTGKDEETLAAAAHTQAQQGESPFFSVSLMLGYLRVCGPFFANIKGVQRCNWRCFCSPPRHCTARLKRYH